MARITLAIQRDTGLGLEYTLDPVLAQRGVARCGGLAGGTAGGH